MDLKTLQERLKKIRSAYKLPVYEAAWISGVSKSAISAWETGVRIPAIDGLSFIAEAYGVSLDWLCGLSSEPYNTDSIRAAEEAFPVTPGMFKEALSKSNGELDVPDIDAYNAAVESYFNDEYGELLPLELRANIVVLTHIITQFFMRTNPNTPSRSVVKKVILLTESQRSRLERYRKGLYSALVDKEIFFY